MIGQGVKGDYLSPFVTSFLLNAAKEMNGHRSISRQAFPRRYPPPPPAGLLIVDVGLGPGISTPQEASDPWDNLRIDAIPLQLHRAAAGLIHPFNAIDWRLLAPDTRSWWLRVANMCMTLSSDCGDSGWATRANVSHPSWNSFGKQKLVWIDEDSDVIYLDLSIMSVKVCSLISSSLRVDCNHYSIMQIG